VRGDEEQLDDKEVLEVLKEAAALDPGPGAAGALLAELRRSPGSFVVVRVRSQAPSATTSLPAPSPEPSPPPPARKPAPVKEGWIRDRGARRPGRAAPG
jgi:hypothetical protein